MSILDTFYILFKSNADDAVKSTQRYDKSTKELEGSLKSATEQSEKLGQAFVKLVESGAALAGAYAGFNIIKQGAIQQTEYNKQLYITSTLYKQNAGELKAFAQAAYQAGGSREGAMSNMISIQQQNPWAKYDPMQQMLAARARYKSLVNSPVAQNEMLYGSQAVFQDPGLANMLQMSDKDFNATLNSTGVKAAGSLTNEQAQKAFEAERAAADLSGSVGKLDTTIASGLIPSLNALIGKLSGLISSAGGGMATSLGLAGAFVAGKALQWGIGGGIATRLLGLGGKAAAATGEVATGGMTAAESAAAFGGAGVAATAGAGALAVTGAVGAASLYAGYKAADLIEPIATWWMERGIKKVPAPLTKSSQAKQSDVDFWKSQGYSAEQAAGIIANMQRESGGNPNAVGDNGSARGLFQWHPDRQKAIFNATGIDVTKAGYQDQLKAAAWEMKNSKLFDDKHYRSISDAGDAGSYFSSHFERPANAYSEALMRGQGALSLASQFPVSSGGTTVNIDKIEIHTAATNADEIARHIKNAVIGTCSEVQSKADNGRFG